MRPYVGRHERPTPTPSTDRAATRARASELVARPVYAGRHEGVQTENR